MAVPLPILFQECLARKKYVCIPSFGATIAIASKPPVFDKRFGIFMPRRYHYDFRSAVDADDLATQLHFVAERAGVSVDEAGHLLEQFGQDILEGVQTGTYKWSSVGTFSLDYKNRISFHPQRADMTFNSEVVMLRKTVQVSRDKVAHHTTSFTDEKTAEQIDLIATTDEEEKEIISVEDSAPEDMHPFTENPIMADAITEESVLESPETSRETLLARITSTSAEDDESDEPFHNPMVMDEVVAETEIPVTQSVPLPEENTKAEKAEEEVAKEMAIFTSEQTAEISDDTSSKNAQKAVVQDEEAAYPASVLAQMHEENSAPPPTPTASGSLLTHKSLRKKNKKVYTEFVELDAPQRYSALQKILIIALLLGGLLYIFLHLFLNDFSFHSYAL